MEKAREIDPRRAELGEFLRNRREQLTPERAGLPSGGRRRTPGLRREEVAEAAQISTALYAWLEQGRDVPVSRRSIDAIASALQLTPGEHRHLHYLASQEEIELREDVSPALRRMVLSFRRFPVFLLDHVWDIVLRNEPAIAVFGGAHGIDDRANMLEELFVHELKNLFVDYEHVAESLLAMFRLDFPAHAEDPRSVALVKRLRENSPLFAELWQRYDVREHPQGIRRLDHAVAGKLAFEPSLLGVVGSPGLRLMLFTPADDETATRLDDLLDRQTASAATDTAPSSNSIVRLA